MANDRTAEDLLNTLDQVQTKIDDLHGEVNSFLLRLPDWVPDFAVKPVIDEWNVLREEWTEIVNDLSGRIETAGEATVLREAAKSWRMNVSSSLTGIPGQLGAGELSSDDVFSGASANAYKSIVPAQQAAIKAMPKQPTAIAEGLDAIADAINSYLTGMQLALTSLGVAIGSATVAIAASGTVVGGLVALAGAVLAAGTFVTSLIVATETFDADTGAVERKWQASFTDWTDFAGERWPRAVFPS